jgi:hypothetical protein
LSIVKKYPMGILLLLKEGIAAPALVCITLLFFDNKIQTCRKPVTGVSQIFRNSSCNGLQNKQLCTLESSFWKPNFHRAGKPNATEVLPKPSLAS